MLVSKLAMSPVCISCSVKNTRKLARVTNSAHLNSCALPDKSLNEYMATKPPISCSKRNSNWYFTATAQMSIVTTCVVKAVRESMNTRINIGPMANGMM